MPDQEAIPLPRRGMDGFGAWLLATTQAAPDS